MGHTPLGSSPGPRLRSVTRYPQALLLMIWLLAQLLRSNLIAATIMTTVTTTPDLYRAAIARSISWEQFGKNLAVNVGGIAAGIGGWMAAGAALGSIVPGAGNAAGTVAGAIGGIAAGILGTWGSKKVMDHFIEDDAKNMLALVHAALEELAADYMLFERELAELLDKVKTTVDAKWLRRMYQAGKGTTAEADRRSYAYRDFEPICLGLLRKRSKISLPPPELVAQEIHHFASDAIQQFTPSDFSSLEPEGVVMPS